MLSNNPFYIGGNVNDPTKFGKGLGMGAPFYSTAFNAIQDNNIYRDSGLSGLGNIGTTTAGQFGQGAADMAISSGNPYAMAAGVAAKSIFGIGDTLDYAFGKKRDFDIQGDNYRTDRLNTYNLGYQQQQAADIGKGIVGEAAKKAGVLAPLGAVAGLFAKGRAKKYRNEANKRIEQAADRFNQSTSSFFDRQGDMDRYRQTQIDSRANRMNFGYQSPF